MGDDLLKYDDVVQQVIDCSVAPLKSPHIAILHPESRTRVSSQARKKSPKNRVFHTLVSQHKDRLNKEINMRVFALAALLVSFTVQAAPASQESVEALLSVTKTEALMDSLYSGMDQMMRQIINQTVQGKSLSAEQRHALDALPTKFVAVMREEMSWQKMKPLYVQLYCETFEQEEVDGMLAFYASPAGKALIKKMPVVMQKSLALSQSLLLSVAPKMRAAMEEAMQEAKITDKK